MYLLTLSIPINMSINELYNKLLAKNIQGGSIEPPLNMPNMRFKFDNGNDKFNTLSIFAYYEGYETILKKDNDCAFDSSIGYDGVCYFQTADEIAEEIKRLVEHLNPSQCECCCNDDDEESSEEVEEENYDMPKLEEINKTESDEEEDEESEESNMLNTLKDLFHMSLLMGVLPRMNTREKMMDMLNTRGSKEWTAEQILKLALDNKIKWIKGSSDPLDNETYQKQMNTRLAEILGEKKKKGRCVDLKINPNAEKYYLFLNNKLRLTADVMDMALPKDIMDKISQPNFWETMEGAFVKSSVSKTLKETENAVHVGCKNTLIVGFKCEEILNQLHTNPSTKRFLDGKKIVEVIITEDVELFQLEDNPKAYIPCIVDASGNETIWKYKVPYHNGMPCCFDKKPETMKEIIEQVVSEFIEEKKLEQLPVAIAELVDDGDIRSANNDTIHYDPLMADTFA